MYMYQGICCFVIKINELMSRSDRPSINFSSSDQPFHAAALCREGSQPSKHLRQTGLPSGPSVMNVRR